MHYLFSRAGLSRLTPFLAEGTLIAFDFDGTLAPLVLDHRRARLPAPTARLLGLLAKHTPVAMLSGRHRRDLKKRTALPLLAWVGNHGLEGAPGGRTLRGVERVVARWAKALEPALARIHGASLENKRYSLSLHYRAAKNPAAARRALLKAVAPLKPAPRVLPGKKVLNLLAPGHRHKGEALLALMKAHGFERAIFIGDDDTDEDVFRLQDPRILSVRVRPRRGSKATVYLRSQPEIERLLKVLLKGE